MLCEPVAEGEPDVYTDFTLPVSLQRHEVTVDTWADGDPGAGFRLLSFSTSRDVDPFDTPFVVVERRHAPPEAAVISVGVIDRLPG